MESGANLFDDIVVVFIAAALGGVAARFVRLPLLVGYLAGGALVGPQALGLVTHVEDVHTLAELGVALLLFAVGVEVSIADLRRAGWRVVAAGTAQIALTMAVGYGVGVALGWSAQHALVAGMALALSSTMVALKTLNDRAELRAVHGRVATGILLVQDLAFVPMMAGVAALAALAQDSGNLAQDFALTVGKAALAVGVIVLLGKAAPPLLKRVAVLGQREMFVIGVLGAMMAAAMLTLWAGLSAALGAFIAGLMLSDSDWAGRHALREVIPVRDIFAGFFFVSLGMLTDVEFFVDNWGYVALFIGVSIGAKLVIVSGLMRLLGYVPSVALRTSMQLVQIGEFSFIIAGAAVAAQLAPDSLLPLVVTAAVVTMGITPSFVAVGSRLLDVLQKRSRRFHRYLAGERFAESAREREPRFRNHVVIAGFGRVGSLIAADLEREAVPHIAIDLDPARAEAQLGRHGHLLYGDSSNDDALRRAGVDRARLLIVATPDHVTSLATVDHARRLNPRLHIVGRASWQDELQPLYDVGADAVVWPELEAALRMVRVSLRDVGVADVEVEELVEEARHELGDHPHVP